MEVKAGYKQTEVGVIPEDWRLSTVGQEFDVKLGKMLDAEKNIGVPKPYLGNRAVQWDRIDISELPTIRMTRSDLDSFRLKRGDLLVCEGGEVGRAAIWHGPIEECYYQKALHRLRPLRGFDSRLMIGFLRRWCERGVLSNYVTQTSIAHLPREKFIKMPLSVPPRQEQRAIAEALSDVDGLLDGLDRLIAKKRDLKQAAMQQLLTAQTRLPGFHGEWKMKPLALVVDFTNGKPHEEHVAPTGQYRLVTLDSIGIDGKLKLEHRSITKWDDSLAKEDIVIILSDLAHGNLLGLCDLIPEDNRYVLNQRVGRLRIKSKVNANPQYLRLQINRHQEYFKNRGQGTSQRHIYRRDIDQLEISFPNPAEQSAIAEVLTDMDAELAALERRREKTRALKQAMMQELLTGRIRLVKPETSEVSA